MRHRATWTRAAKSKPRALRPPLAFVLALLLGGRVEPDLLNANTVKDLTFFTDNEDLQLIVDEGRRQLDAQSSRFENVQGRAQNLLTAALVVLAFAAGGFRRLDRVHDATLLLSWVLWVVGLALALAGLALAAAIIVVRADFQTIDTTQMTGWAPPILRRLAKDYGVAVILGETTIAARVTLFRQSTRCVCWAAVAIAFLWVVSQ